MTDHPSTFAAGDTHNPGVEWSDRATIHRKDDEGGLLHAMEGLHRGTLAQMVAMVASMPEDQRNQFEIHKAGDRRLDIAEIMALAGRDDLPG